MTDKEVSFLEAVKMVENLKDALEVAYTQLNNAMSELGLDAYVQDPETKLVYRIVKPKGSFVYYKEVDYVRTAKEGERAGTLSKKEAELRGFNLK